MWFLSIAELAMLVVMATVTHSSDVLNKKIEWVTVYQSEAVLMRIDPAGYEQGHHFFLCRIEESGRLYTGKLRYNEGKIHCLAPVLEAELSYTNFQVLSVPTGSTSWVPHPGHTPVNAIKTTENVYVCRAVYGSYVIPGSLEGDGNCHVGLSGDEIIVRTIEDIEILVINKYGEKFGVTQSPETEHVFGSVLNHTATM